jgi:hypothetical protein
MRLGFRQKQNSHKLLAAVTMLVLASPAVWASEGIAVLDFELKDLTLLPNSPQERQRTASIAPQLRQAIDLKKKYKLVAIDPAAQKSADAAFGYLFDHPEEAARLGQQHGADYIAVGRLHKPSFLFVYLLVHLVDVKTQRLAGDYVVEIKGDLEELTRRGVAHLADQIETTLNAKVPK